ncbi:MAG: hypothetical protein GX335_09500, partial [Firmicutes bacterium]|nr:hypothetical protein [Bacillota bacterium]
MFLVFSLVLAFFAPAAWASAPHFGEELGPLSEEELSAVEGEFSGHLLVAAGGAVAGGIGYLITT